MIQQEQPIASPNGTPAFKEVVLSSVRYHLRVDGPEKTKEDFRVQKSFYSHLDEWPEIQREADDLILAYEQPSNQTTTIPTDKPLQNTILKKNHNGYPIDFEKIRQIIALHFICELCHFYDWLALWRILFDLKLLEDTRLSTFAEQMNSWFPNASKRCKADSMGDYSAPYLGAYPFASWTEEAFIDQKTTKQSLTGFRRICRLCETIREPLKKIPVIR